MDFSAIPELQQTLEGLKRSMFQYYYEKGLGGIEEMTKFIEQQKEKFKETIKAKTGKAVRKTPKRGNKLVEIERRLQARPLDFGNKEDDQSPKLRSLSAKKTGTLFTDAVRAVVDRKDKMTQTSQDPIRRATSPVRSKLTQQSETLVAPVLKRFGQKPIFKKSEILRQMEAKQKTVINNREEFIRSKAERAKRDREERAQRVLLNKKKKEKRREADLKAIRQGELELEELRRLQGSPAKGVSAHPSRANSKSPSRARLGQSIPIKPVRVLQHKDRPKLREVARKFGGNAVATPTKNPVKRKSVLTSMSHEWKQIGGYREANDHVADNQFFELDEAEEVLENYGALFVQNDIKPDKHDREIDVNDMEVKDSFSVAVAKDSGVKPKSELNVVEETKHVLGSTFIVGGNADDEEHSVSVEENSGRRSGAIEKEKEEARDKLGILDSSQLKNKNLMNVAACSSYAMTPDKKPAASTEDNYNIDDLSSGDETDEEDNPKNKVPNWAQSSNLHRALREQSGISSKALDAFFGVMKTPSLTEIFSIQRSRYFIRTSSAQWSSPLTNPREGVSRYFWLQKRK